MPNRILKESICINEQIDDLTAFEETVFYRLIVICDDFGRFDGRISVLKGRMFPLKDEKLKPDTLEKALKSLVRVGLVQLYKVGGKPFLALTGWERNQQKRAKYSKFPAPEEADTGAEEKQPEPPPEPLPVPKPEKSPVTPLTEQPAISLPLNNGEMHAVTVDEVKKYKDLYQAIDVMQELRKMHGWLDANPTRRKTKAGIRRFINSWLSKAQDKARPAQMQPIQQLAPESSHSGNPFKRG